MYLWFSVSCVVLCILWRVGDIPSSAYFEAFLVLFYHHELQFFIILVCEKDLKKSSSLLHYIAMRRRVYLLESVCSRGPFNPVSLRHALCSISLLPPPVFSLLLAPLSLRLARETLGRECAVSRRPQLRLQCVRSGCRTAIYRTHWV